MTNRTIYLAGGCFWGTQKFFDQFEGVISTEVGYANGPDDVNSPDDKNSPASAPTYQDVCNNSGHAETVRIDYDDSVLSLTDLPSRTLWLTDLYWPRMAGRCPRA